MDDRAWADDGIFVKHGIRKEGDILTDVTTCHDGNSCMDRGPILDRYVITNRCTEMDVDILTHFCRWTDDGCRADTDPLCIAGGAKMCYDF